MSNVLFYLCLAMLVSVALVMLGLILSQKGRGAGALFGGTSGHTVFGLRSPQVVTWLTAGAFAIFLTLAVVLNLIA